MACFQMAEVQANKKENSKNSFICWPGSSVNIRLELFISIKPIVKRVRVVVNRAMVVVFGQSSNGFK